MGATGASGAIRCFWRSMSQNEMNNAKNDRSRAYIILHYSLIIIHHSLMLHSPPSQNKINNENTRDDQCRRTKLFIIHYSLFIKISYSAAQERMNNE
jgi:hypothetical protein